MKKIVLIFLLSVFGGFTGAYLFHELQPEKDFSSQPVTDQSGLSDQIYSQPVKTDINDLSEDFVKASTISTSSVVYIKNISEQTVSTSFFDLFFGDPGRVSETVSTGSGVIFSRDGYIVTNNHVVEDAKRIEVIHNKKTFNANLVGTDPSTDLAVLKIDGHNLPAIPFGSSRDLQVGEWVLAVGNPFNLTSTVTAGIVSAKGRNINIVKGKFPIESFIQTDAAINPGNSGGALVNKNGELVGINTAILSRTGSYAGYGFAVPIDIAKKVVRDIIEYGEVQKSFMGADVTNIDDQIAENLSLNIDREEITGVAVTYVQDDGAAAKAGLKDGDVIIALDNIPVDSKSTFDEIISTHSPGDQIGITYLRKGEKKDARITLTNKEGTTEIIKSEIFPSESLGADLESVSKVEKDRLEIDHGVRIKKIYRGSDRGLMAELDIEEGFIVTDINNYPIKEPQDLTKILSKVRGRVRIDGVNNDGVKGYYNFYFR